MYTMIILVLSYIVGYYRHVLVIFLMYMQLCMHNTQLKSIVFLQSVLEWF